MGNSFLFGQLRVCLGRYIKARYGMSEVGNALDIWMIEK